MADVRRAADGREQRGARLVVRCIQSLKDSTAEQASALFAKWGNKTTAEAKDVLAKKDVTVTNQNFD